MNNLMFNIKFVYLFFLTQTRSDTMALILVRGENNSKILNAIADIERHAGLTLETKPKKVDAKFADKIVENVLKAPLRTKSKVAAAFRVKEDTTIAILQVKKIHPPAHIVVVSNTYDGYKELSKIIKEGSVFRGYYSNKTKATQMKDYKSGKSSTNGTVNSYM